MYAQICDTNGRTALHLAAMDGDVERIKVLLVASSKLVNMVDRWRRSPLHYACIFATKSRKYPEKDVIRLLASYGADTTAVDAKGNLPLFYMASFGRRRTILYEMVVAAATQGLFERKNVRRGRRCGA